MRVERAYPPRIHAEDLPDEGSLEVTISAVRSVLHRDGTQARALTFLETPAEWVLSKRNWCELARLLDQDDDEKWVGARVVLTRRRETWGAQLVDVIRPCLPGENGGAP
jgi:hypothetical protein